MSGRRAHARGGRRNRRHGAGGRADADEREGRARSLGTPRTPHVVKAEAAHARRGRGVFVASRTQRGKHARAQAQAHDKEGEGERDKARGTALQRRVRFSEEFSGGGRLKQRRGGGKMDAKAVVLEELKRGGNSDELVNALSLLTSLE